MAGRYIKRFPRRIGRSEARMAALVTVGARSCYRWFFGTPSAPKKVSPSLHLKKIKTTAKKNSDPQIKYVEGGNLEK